ncbi:MAG: hypothetical protein WC510_05185 [Candidatus Omnitrophota bacterium]
MRKTKEKVGILYRLIHCFIYHPWLKLIALILAVMVWLYARGEINRFN